MYSIVREDEADPAVQVMTQGGNIILHLEGNTAANPVVAAALPSKIEDTNAIRIAKIAISLPHKSPLKSPLSQRHGSSQVSPPMKFSLSYQNHLYSGMMENETDKHRNQGNLSVLAFAAMLGEEASEGN